MFIRQMTLVVIGCLAMVLCVLGPTTSKAQYPPRAYELYSWQELDGRWRFCLLASPSGPNISAEQVFDKKVRLLGVKDLKRKISELPSRATIFWLDRISGTTSHSQADKIMGLPPRETIQAVRHYAAARQIQVELPAASHNQK